MTTVRRRCVFYVSGFDPKGAAHYHGLYREQAALQAAAGGLQVEVGARKRLPNGDASWSVQATEDGVRVDTLYQFLRWDDIVRENWPRKRHQLWSAVLVTSLFNLRHGSLWRMFRMSWPMAVALFIPFAAVCGLLLGGPLLAMLAAWLSAHATGSWLAAVPAVAAVAFLLVLLERRLDARFNMYWLMRSYAFIRRQVLGRTPELEARLDAQAAQVAERLREAQADEVLVVGHSSGANNAVQVVARALRLMGGTAQGARPVLSLLTLGQCLPVTGAIPQATVFRQELAELGQARGLHWIDFSAPPDASCFPLCDPMATLDVPGPSPLPDHPKLLSPRFAEMFDAAGYRSLKKDKFRMHFQYLMASERAVDYDYFRITAGARTLGQRFAHCESVRDYAGLRPFGAGLG
jgi:hypothetical protein